MSSFILCKKVIFIINNSYTILLDNHTFYKGDTINIPFSFYYGDGSLIDLRRVEVRFYMFPYGQSEMKVYFGNKDYKVGVLSEKNNNECYILLTSQETECLEFTKYTYVPRLCLIDGTNRQYIRGEGQLIFKES